MLAILACLVFAAASPVPSPAGDSTATAIVDPASNESDGVAWEYRYLRMHPCDGQTQWNLKQQTLVQANGRVYDRLHVACLATKTERDYFFDITSYFGKM